MPRGPCHPFTQPSKTKHPPTITHLVHQECRDAAGALAAGAGHDEVQVTHARPADEGLAAAQDVVSAVPLGGGLEGSCEAQGARVQAFVRIGGGGDGVEGGFACKVTAKQAAWRWSSVVAGVLEEAGEEECGALGWWVWMKMHEGGTAQSSTGSLPE